MQNVANMGTKTVEQDVDVHETVLVIIFYRQNFFFSLFFSKFITILAITFERMLFF